MEKEKIENLEETPKEVKKEKKKKDHHNDELINKLELALTEEKAKSIRVQAEMMNFKKRKEDELASFLKYANSDLITDLLPIVDNFERAIKMDSEDPTDEISRFLEGFKMIYTNLLNVLNKCEVKEIAADGVEFDPKYHQAVLTEKDENKPIRPAMVKVNE